MKWFKHESDARKDETIQLLDDRYGKPKGYSMFFKALEFFAQNWSVKREFPVVEFTIKKLAAAMGVRHEKALDFLEVMATIGKWCILKAPSDDKTQAFLRGSKIPYDLELRHNSTGLRHNSKIVMTQVDILKQAGYDEAWRDEVLSYEATRRAVWMVCWMKMIEKKDDFMGHRAALTRKNSEARSMETPKLKAGSTPNNGFLREEYINIRREDPRFWNPDSEEWGKLKSEEQEEYMALLAALREGAGDGLEENLNLMAAIRDRVRERVEIGQENVSDGPGGLEGGKEDG